MEKRDIFIIALVLLVSIGVRLLRSRMAKKRADSSKGEASGKSDKLADSGDDYEPYSGQ